MNQEILNKLIEKLPLKVEPYEKASSEQDVWSDVGYNQAIRDCISSLPEVIKEYDKWLVEEIEKEKERYIPNEECTGFCMPEVTCYKDGRKDGLEFIINLITNK